MLVERTFHCSRSECETHLTTLKEWPPLGVSTCDLDSRSVDWFCSWDCVLLFAGQRSPLEQIDL